MITLKPYFIIKNLTFGYVQKSIIIILANQRKIKLGGRRHWLSEYYATWQIETYSYNDCKHLASPS
jgi:hypothetical protein